LNIKRKKKILETLDGCVDLNGTDLEKYFLELQEIGLTINKKKSFIDILRFCSTLGNQERLKIIHCLRIKNYCVCELEAILDKSQSTISHHLKEMEDTGLIRGWKKGKFTHYEINKKKLDFYRDLLEKTV